MWGMVVRREMAFAIDRYKARSGPETMCAIRIFEVLCYLQVLFFKNLSMLDMSHHCFEVIQGWEFGYGIPYRQENSPYPKSSNRFFFFLSGVMSSCSSKCPLGQRGSNHMSHRESNLNRLHTLLSNSVKGVASSHDTLPVVCREFRTRTFGLPTMEQKYVFNETKAREIDQDIVNKWRNDWLAGQDKLNRPFSAWLRKLDEPGTAYCLVCNKKLLYRSNGKKVFNLMWLILSMSRQLIHNNTPQPSPLQSQS